MSLLDFDFMRRALLAAVVVVWSHRRSACSWCSGGWPARRRHGSRRSHRCRAGIPDRQRPVPTALVVVVAGAIGIEVLRIRSRSAGDVILALVFYGGIAGGVLLTYLAGNRAASSLNQYLFGAITTVSSQDLIWLVGASLALLVILAVFGREMFAVSFRPRVARTQGIRTRLHRRHDHHPGRGGGCHRNANGRIAAGHAVMIVPIAAAQQVTRSFRGTAGVGILVVCSAQSAVSSRASAWTSSRRHHRADHPCVLRRRTGAGRGDPEDGMSTARRRTAAGGGGGSADRHRRVPAPLSRSRVAAGVRRTCRAHHRVSQPGAHGAGRPGRRAAR